MEASVSPPAMERRLAVRPGNPGPLSGSIQFPWPMLCRCSGADCKSALLLFPSRGGLVASNTNPALPRMGGRAWGQGSARARGAGVSSRAG